MVTHKSLQRRLILPLCLFLSGLVGSPQLLAEGSQGGLLWKLKVGEEAPSYLFGTIHSDDPRVLKLPTAVSQAFQESSSFCMEILFNPRTMQELQGSMLLPAGKSLRKLLDEKTWAQMELAFSQRGTPITAAHDRLKPWAVFMTLSVPKPKTGLALDLKLMAMAREQNKKVCGLESVSEQTSVFDELPTERQIYLLQGVLKLDASMEAYFETMIKAYLAQDLQQLERLAKQNIPLEDKKFARQLFKRLLDDRNQRMVERVVPRVRRGGVFIAVGALHLPGSQGLIELLRQQRVQVTPVH